MKKIMLLAFSVHLLLLQHGYSQKLLNGAITYIGNEGFMIENRGKKICIDALYNHYDFGNSIETVDPVLEELIVEGSEPFSNSQLILVTHNHPDHYNAVKVTSFLTNNPSTYLIAPVAIAVSISDETLQDQLVGITAEKYEPTDTTVNDIPLSVCNLKHNTAWSSEYNSGYIVTLDSLTIMHCGDNVLDDTTEIKNYTFNEMNIDVAFLNLGCYQKPYGIDFVNRYINPKYVVLMHVVPDSARVIKERYKNLSPPVFVFCASMEKLLITDTLYFGNRRPEKFMDVPDTSLQINTYCEFTIPRVFTDPDTGDSLTYSVTGLPSGLTFDAGTMIISGTPERALTFDVWLVATDMSLCPNHTKFVIEVERETGTGNTGQNSIMVYPTLFNAAVYIANLNGKSTISVFTIDGILVKEIQAEESLVEIDLSGLINGSYIVRIENNATLFSKRIIKSCE